MKRTALKVLLVVLLAGAAFMTGNLIGDLIAPAKPPPPEKYGSIVRLVDNGRTYCSGTVVAPNLLITAAHCVLMETPFGLMRVDKVAIRPSTNEPVDTAGIVIYATPQMDQAMVTGDFKDYNTRKFLTDPEKLSKIGVKSTKFISCGFPLNGDLYCNETVFDHRADFFWAVNGVLIPGMSGGPTFLPDGTMVGVNVAVQGDKSMISPIYNITRNIRSK